MRVPIMFVCVCVLKCISNEKLQIFFYAKNYLFFNNKIIE